MAAGSLGDYGRVVEDRGVGWLQLVEGQRVG